MLFRLGFTIVTAETMETNKDFFLNLKTLYATLGIMIMNDVTSTRVGVGARVSCPKPALFKFTAPARKDDSWAQPS